ncbi:hypothetical protein V8J39_13840 [Frigidibacter sp. MR17.24]
MRHDPGSGALGIMVRSMKMYGMAQRQPIASINAMVCQWSEDNGEERTGTQLPIP